MLDSWGIIMHVFYLNLILTYSYLKSTFFNFNITIKRKLFEFSTLLIFWVVFFTLGNGSRNTRCSFISFECTQRRNICTHPKWHKLQQLVCLWPICHFWQIASSENAWQEISKIESLKVAGWSSEMLSS